MAVVLAETSQNNTNILSDSFYYYAIKWRSFTILKNASGPIMKCFRQLEKSMNKINKLQNDIQFNTFCLENDLFPNYTKMKMAKW